MQHIEVNEFQTPIADLHLENEPAEIQEQFFDFVSNVPYIKNLISPTRKRAKDLPRDKEGKIIVDLTQPHILEDMDYFMPSRLNYLKTGKYTELRPNPNPNSDYGKWIREEVRRCYYGYVRPSDGEWVTGDMYFFMNYCPMQIIEDADDSKKNNDEEVSMGERRMEFPRFWEGHYLLFHYLYQARKKGSHCMMLASRGKGKSYCGAGMLAKRIILGENERVNKKTVCYITASDKSYLLGGDQTLDKFIYNIDFCALNTQFPASRITNSTNNMKWVFGYKDLDTNTFRGSQNAVVGVSSAKDEAKLRGTRGVLYVLEEMGTFPTLLNLYGNMRHSVEQGKKVFGTIFAYGTAGDNESDFSAAQEMMYNPNGYNLYALPNVYDKEGQARKHFVYFFPGYINYEGCYNKDGVSDVTKAILLLLKDRYVVKYNSTNPNAITKRIAESPIVPQEAILRTAGNLFPITQINERIAQLDNDPNAFDDVYTGDFTIDKGNTVKFVPTNDTPILDFPLKNNTDRGAVQIFQMPSKDSNGKVFANRYIGGFDPRWGLLVMTLE